MSQSAMCTIGEVDCQQRLSSKLGLYIALLRNTFAVARLLSSSVAAPDFRK